MSTRKHNDFCSAVRSSCRASGRRWHSPRPTSFVHGPTISPRAKGTQVGPAGKSPARVRADRVGVRCYAVGKTPQIAAEAVRKGRAANRKLTGGFMNTDKVIADFQPLLEEGLLRCDGAACMCRS
jgi:hypothetical protein